MTRFAPHGPRVEYTPTEQPKGFQQLAGLYNMWQALPASTRDKIIEAIFGPKLDGEIISTDSSMTPPVIPGEPVWDALFGPEWAAQKDNLFNSEWAKTGTTNSLAGLPSLPTDSTDISEWWTGTFGDRPDERISGAIRSGHKQYSNTFERLHDTVYKLPSVGRR